MKLVDITGKDPLAPACPRCNKPTGLIPYIRKGIAEARLVGGETGGFWHCPGCYKVFKYESDITPA